LTIALCDTRALLSLRAPLRSTKPSPSERRSSRQMCSSCLPARAAKARGWSLTMRRSRRRKKEGSERRQERAFRTPPGGPSRGTTSSGPIGGAGAGRPRVAPPPLEALQLSPLAELIGHPPDLSCLRRTAGRCCAPRSHTRQIHARRSALPRPMLPGHPVAGVRIHLLREPAARRRASTGFALTAGPQWAGGTSGTC